MSKLRTFEGSFPLAWPTGWKRTTPADRRWNHNMKAGWATSRANLQSELGTLGAVSALISSNMPLGRSGLPIETRAPIQDPGVAVYFAMPVEPGSREPAQLVFACDRWERVEHNLRAISLHVAAMRGMDRWGVGSMDQAFKGYLALPEKATPSRRPWTVVLALGPDATRDAVLGRFRELARIRHPDGGGQPGELDELIQARDAALEELARRGS